MATSVRPLRLDPSEARLERVIGSGTLGLVYRGRIRENFVTIKVLPFEEGQEELIEDFKSEIELPLFIRHPNLCLFMGYTLEHPFMVVDEYLERGMMEALGDPVVRGSLPMRVRMAREIALGISWLHRNSFVHLNLKPSNVFVYGHYSVKLADYNLKKTRRNLSRGREGGMPCWKAPEVLCREFGVLEGWREGGAEECLCEHEKLERSDVYSFSVLLWQLVTMREPLEGGLVDLGSYVRSVVVEGLRPEVEGVRQEGLRRLIVSGWDADPGRRPGISEVLKSLEHALVDCVVSDALANQFWKSRVTRVFESEQVNWREFCNAFFEFLGVTQPGSLGIVDLIKIDHYRVREAAVRQSVRCVHRLLGDGECVKLEDFGRMVDRFGPILPRSRAGILDRILGLLSRPWFHGDITAEEARSRLEGKQFGTFLVRFSSSCQAEFAVSKVVESGVVQHHRIRRVVEEGGGGG